MSIVRSLLPDFRGMISIISGLYCSQVLCGVCHSYSAHLYERLGAELGYDGMNMKREFCEELVDACDTQPNCPTYADGEGYCDVHSGTGHDYFWSYPYTEREPDGWV